MSSLKNTSSFLSSSEQAYFAFTYSSLLIGAQPPFSFSALPFNLREPIVFQHHVAIAVPSAFGLGLIELTGWGRERGKKNPLALSLKPVTFSWQLHC